MARNLNFGFPTENYRNTEKYTEKIVEGYYYTGNLSLALENLEAGGGGGGGGAGGGNGGIVVFITSSLAKPRVDEGTVLFDVSGGTRGQYGTDGSGSSNAGWGITGYDGELIKIIM